MKKIFLTSLVSLYFARAEEVFGPFIQDALKMKKYIEDHVELDKHLGAGVSNNTPMIGVLT